jgi:vacuolar-type H+-ATPase subunit H
MDLRKLIDELQGLTEHAMHLPGGKVVLDQARVNRLIADMRAAVPDEGKRLAQERDRILNDARMQARRMIEDAQAQVNSRLEEQNAVQLARERARQIVAEAEQNGARIRADANSYVVNQLGALESRLQRVLHEVQSGQRYLTQGEAETSTHS